MLLQQFLGALALQGSAIIIEALPITHCEGPANVTLKLLRHRQIHIHAAHHHLEMSYLVTVEVVSEVISLHTIHMLRCGAESGLRNMEIEEIVETIMVEIMEFIVHGEHTLALQHQRT